ncbi:hypothetical protein CAPTEDRAFT_71737, partial [Capitella teleta]
LLQLQEYSMTVFFRQQWRDHRLSFGPYADPVTLNYKQISDIWIPDSFFRNEKDAKLHKITVPNRLISVTRVGTVTYSQRLTLTLSCQLDLRSYPMDNQTCYIYIET